MSGSVSISHCRAGVAVAFDEFRTVGVDIETLRPQLQRVKTRFLSQAQLETMVTPAQLLEAWTIKEALYKAMLTPGLRLPISTCMTRDGRLPRFCPAENVTLTLVVEK